MLTPQAERRCAPKHLSHHSARHLNAPSACGADDETKPCAGYRLISPHPSTTLADCVFAAVFQGFAFGNMGTAEAAAEG